LVVTSKKAGQVPRKYSPRNIRLGALGQSFVTIVAKDEFGSENVVETDFMNAEGPDCIITSPTKASIEAKLFIRTAFLDFNSELFRTEVLTRFARPQDSENKRILVVINSLPRGADAFRRGCHQHHIKLILIPLSQGLIERIDQAASFDEGNEVFLGDLDSLVQEMLLEGGEQLRARLRIMLQFGELGEQEYAEMKELIESAKGRRHKNLRQTLNGIFSAYRNGT
jgi:hypothetical protein